MADTRILWIWLPPVLLVSLGGLIALLRLVSSLRWLKRGETLPRTVWHDAPTVVLLVPAIREQSVISDTLDGLAELAYPADKLRIVVITTERESRDRLLARRRLTSLARNIAAGKLPKSLLFERYLGVLPADLLKQAIALASGRRSEAKVRELIRDMFEASPTTAQIVAERVRLLNERIGMPVFFHEHYPRWDGGVNEQLCYAMERLPSAVRSVPPNALYIGRYDADSHPHRDTLRCLAAECRDYCKLHGTNPPVLQQSAVFLQNLDNLRCGLRGALLQAAALLQTQWVLTHEIPRLRRQCHYALKSHRTHLTPFERLSGAEFALCVGHGLFVRYDVLQELELFTKKGITEDIVWSFHLCVEHVPILPLPILESAESPSTLKSLVLQKGAWFLGYLEYPRCRRNALRTRRLERASVELVTLHALFGAAKWILLSPMLSAVFLLPLVSGSWYLLVIALAVHLVLGFLPYAIILAQSETLRVASGGNWHRVNGIRATLLVAFSLPAFLTESLGPWWGLLQKVAEVATGNAARKAKTER